MNNEYGLTIEISSEFIKEIEKVLSCSLEAHDSLYKGDYWLYRNNELDRNVELGFNIDPLHDPEKDPPEEYYFNFDFKECVALLSVDGDPNWVNEIHESLMNVPNIKFIKSESYEWN